jgi:hypothetical protein
MFLGDAYARNAQDIADLFGEYFQGVYVRDDSQNNCIVDDGVEDSFTVSLIQLEEETVEQTWARRDIFTDSEKDWTAVVKKPHAILFNLSLLSGVFPCVWKESYVVLLFKSGEKKNILNYRGISS